MSRRIDNYNKRKQNRRRTLRQKAFISSAAKLLCCAVLCTILFGGFYTSAHGNRSEEPVNFKYYKSITVESGDSLWSLAEEYLPDDYDSIDEYVDALMIINNLDHDHIQYGDKIIIAYNDTTYLE